ncbi:MAG: hypothetical protein EP299_05845 [Acidobacteria bacterium]|nr:MAG: hypothetical protein EP299_05845 [Acidobacteriota bacterium]
MLWVAWAEQELLEDVPHRQVVFTIPKRLRIFFRYDRKLLGELAACAWRALRLYFDVSFDGAEVTPGAVGFLQTSGELLNFHPHVHILVTDGGFRPDGSFYHLPGFNSRHLERLLRAEILRTLVDKGLIGEETVRNLLTWRHSGFSIHGAVRVKDRQGAARLGRYMIRCPLALKRLSWNEETAQVGYTARPTRRVGPGPTAALAGGERTGELTHSHGSPTPAGFQYRFTPSKPETLGMDILDGPQSVIFETDSLCSGGSHASPRIGPSGARRSTWRCFHYCRL